VTKVVRISLAAVVLLAAAMRGRPAAAQQTCATAACHEKLLKGKTLHPVTETCDTCHESTATPHPQKGKKTFKLASPQPDVCASCHEPFKKANVHAPVKEGTCTTCHDPHSSAEPKLLSAPAKELCATCHADHVEFKLMHGPVSAGECLACHTPHESAAKGLLVKAQPDLCFVCHTDMAGDVKKKVVHAALEGGCTSCHNPHGSANAKLLADKGAAVCFACHADIGEKVEKAAFQHAPIKSEKGCASCHSPHASDHPKLLGAPQAELCASCHKNVITKTMTVLHKPVAEGKCGACHDPHGAANAKLLVKGFPAEPYTPYTETSYELCFTCHKRELLQYPDTSFATNFRDGERNLHFVHVNNKQKGRSCRLCHAIHGGENPKLIADKVPFGQWSLPIKFTKTETGGSCAPGCHKPQTYDRGGKKTAAPSPTPPPKKK
jgi:predicted CXXCH cytochrome family protein